MAIPAQVSPVSALYSGGIVPPGAAHVHRFPWQRPRWWDYVEARKLRCPAGHHLPNTYEIDEDGSGCIRCNDRSVKLPGGCGLWVWALRLRGGSHMVVEVTERDLKALRELSHASEKLAYLAIFEQLERIR